MGERIYEVYRSVERGPNSQEVKNVVVSWKLLGNGRHTIEHGDYIIELSVLGNKAVISVNGKLRTWKPIPLRIPGKDDQSSLHIERHEEGKEPKRMDFS